MPASHCEALTSLVSGVNLTWQGGRVSCCGQTETVQSLLSGWVTQPSIQKCIHWCIVHLYLYVSMTLKQTICMFKFIENWGHPFPLQTTQIFVVPWFHWNVGRTRQFSWRPLEWWHSARPQTPACAPSPESGSSSDTQTNRRAVKS